MAATYLTSFTPAGSMASTNAMCICGDKLFIQRGNYFERYDTTTYAMEDTSDTLVDAVGDKYLASDGTYVYFGLVGGGAFDGFSVYDPTTLDFIEALEATEAPSSVGKIGADSTYLYHGRGSYPGISIYNISPFAFNKEIEADLSNGCDASSDGTYIYITDPVNHTLAVRLISDGSSVDNMSYTPNHPTAIDISNGELCVLLAGANLVSRVDSATLDEIEQFAIGANSRDIACTATKIFVLRSTDVEVYSRVAGTVPDDPTLLTATCTVSIGETDLLDSPVTSFESSVLTGTEPLTVTFTDTSLNTPTSWSWDFGDGTTSTDQNPTHIFSAGTWPVTLTATNASGYRMFTVTILVLSIAVVTPPTGGGTIPTGEPGQTVLGALGLIGYYSVDRLNHRVIIHGETGAQLGTFGELGTGNAQFFYPTTLSVVNGRQLIDRVTINPEDV